MAILSLIVGLIAIGYDGVPRVIDAWILVNRPPSGRHHVRPLLPIAFLAASVVLVAVAALLVVAGGISFRWPILGLRLHVAYVCAMLPLAAIFACIYAAALVSDGEVPPEFALVAFFLVGAWFAAYPTFVAFVVYRRLRHLLPEEAELLGDEDPWNAGV